MEIPNMYLNYFTGKEDFPFFIQFGYHKKEMFVHTHTDFSELVIILGGTATHIVNGEEYPIKKGDVFVVNNFTTHGYTNADNFRICNIMFDPEYFIPLLNDIRTSAGFHALFVIEPILAQHSGFQAQLTLQLEDFTNIYGLVQSIKEEFETKPVGYRTMITSLFSQIMTQLSRLYGKKQIAHSDNSISIAAAVAYMENHYREELDIDELAAMSGMSVRHFRRIFHSIYRTSPIKYITSLRIRAAIQLLGRSDLSVTEIAIRCGFSDGNYFSSRFKQNTGKSPLEYRRFLQEP